MFKSVATKIAHNSTIPSLGVNRDLRPLQDLITAEKAVVNAVQHFSLDISKASESLRQWGVGEGDDLTDILTASNALLLHFASALNGFSKHGMQIREHLKAVRTREERLDEMRRRRKALMSQADAADKRVMKMSPEHKNYQLQKDMLGRLKEEIRIMDTDIMTEEANLGDFKRASTKALLGLKFGGLLELSEKGAIVGELGKLVIAEIPTEPTEPGLPRPYYSSHPRTEFLVSEAQRLVYEVAFSAEPNPEGDKGFQAPSAMSEGSGPSSDVTQPPLDLTQYPPRPSDFPQPPSGPTANPQSGLPPVPSHLGSSSSPSSSNFSGLPPVQEFGMGPSQQQHPYPAEPSLSEHSVTSDTNEFGQMPTGPLQTSSFRDGEDREVAGGYIRGPRFATFPVKATGPRPTPNAYPYATATSPRMASSPGLQLGDRPPSLDVNRESDSFSSSVAEALGQRLPSERSPSFPSPTVFPTPAVDPSRQADSNANAQYGGPPPTYSSPITPPASASQATLSQFHANNQPQHDHQYDVRNSHGLEIPPVVDDRDEEDASLAYMTDAQATESYSSVPQADTGFQRGEWSEIQGPHNLAQQGVQFAEAGPGGVQSTGNGFQLSDVPPTTTPRSEHFDEEGRVRQSVQRVPPPRLATPPAGAEESYYQDEHSAAQAAAAREVSRELDSLMFNSPPLPAVRTPSPLVPPQRPFAHRTVSPRPPFENMPSAYVRERDRNMGSPTSASGGEQNVVPSVASGLSNDSLRESASPSPPLSPAHQAPGPQASLTSLSNGGTPYRTPAEYPTTPSGTASAPASAFYNLPSISTTGSHSSFSSPVAPAGARTISAAAFRRPQIRTASQSASESDAPSAAGDTTSPLVVKKRPLPASPYPSRGLSLGPGSPMIGRIPSAPPPNTSQQDLGLNQDLSRARSASAMYPSEPSGEGDAPQYPRASEDEQDYDYVSSYYTNSTPNAPVQGDRSQNGNGYGGGRFATNLEEESLR